MKIPALDMAAQIAPIRKEIDEAIKNVIDGHNFILGEETKLLEEEIAAYCDVKHAIGVSSGTDAIVLALKALGIGFGDAVICPSFTYYATAGAIARTGTVPVFADIDAQTYNVSEESVEDILKNIKSSVRNTIRAIIPVHLYGQCADMDAIVMISKKYGLKTIEDAAQAFGAAYKGKKAGTLGDCGAVSFYPGKNLGAFGDAGCILTNNNELADKLRILRNQGASPKDKYRHIELGHNARLDAIQAAVLRVKLKYLDKWNKKRAQNAQYYNKNLKDTGIITPRVPEYNSHIYHQYTLRTDKDKEKIKKHLISRGIDSRTFYPIPLHLQPCFEYLGYKKGDLPVSEMCAEKTFVIPVYPELTKEQMDYVISAIKESLG